MRFFSVWFVVLLKPQAHVSSQTIPGRREVTSARRMAWTLEFLQTHLLQPRISAHPTPQLLPRPALMNTVEVGAQGGPQEWPTAAAGGGW